MTMLKGMSLYRDLYHHVLCLLKLHSVRMPNKGSIGLWRTQNGYSEWLKELVLVLLRTIDSSIYRGQMKNPFGTFFSESVGL